MKGQNFSFFLYMKFYVHLNIYIWQRSANPLKGGCQSQDVKSDKALTSIYGLRMFRRETLLWTNLLNRSPAPLSRSPMLHSNSCNCSSLQTNEFFFRNAFETRDHFGIAICLDKRCNVDSSREVVISLASLKCLTILQSSLSEPLADLG